MNIFVTGTDTDVGKTIATASIARALYLANRTVGVMKPMASGVTDGVGEDARLLIAAAHTTDSVDIVCPVRMRTPVAPAVAAEKEGVSIDVNKLISGANDINKRYDDTLVEGVGGWVVPITKSCTLEDFAKKLNWPVLIIARAGLGTINHTSLTIRAIKSAGLPILGVVLVHTTKGIDDPSVKTNAEEIKKITNTEVLFTIPYIEGVDIEHLNETAKFVNIEALSNAWELCTNA